MVITFDFDDTLRVTKADREYDPETGTWSLEGIIYTDDQNPVVFPKFEAALNRGDEVHIVTSRSWSKDTVEEMQAWLRSQGITRIPPIHFTGGALKHDTLARLGSRQHFDDDPEELSHLPRGCRGVQAPLHSSWTEPMNEAHVRQWVRSLLNR